MRRFFLLATLFFAPIARAQDLDNPNLVLPPVPVAAATPIPTPAAPLDPLGSAPITPDEVTRGQEAPNGRFNLEPVHGDVIYDMEKGLAVATGGAIFTYREFSGKADRGVVDFNTNRATLSGNLSISVRGQTFSGQSLSFDLDSGRWILSRLAATFPPEFFPPGTVLQPIFVRNGSVFGKNDLLGGQDFDFTSCDRDHYSIRSKKLTFYRTADGRPERIVLRHNVLRIFGRQIAPLPVYVISLLGQQTRQSALQTSFGQNSDDGVFVRTLYNLRADQKKTDSLLLDAFSKRGLGLGLQREFAEGAGLLSLYSLSNKVGGREVDARADRSLQLSKLLRADLNFASTRNNSPQNPGSSSQNGNFSLFRDGQHAQSSLSFTSDNSNYGFGQSDNGSINFQHRQEFGAGLSLEAESILSRSRNFNSPDYATSDQTLTLGKTGNLFDVFLRSELHNDLSQSQTYQLERLPELTLQSSTTRLPIPGLSQIAPGDFTLGLGRFNEPGSGVKLSRADFFYTGQDRNFNLLGSGTSTSNLRVGGLFEQAFYSNDTARYNYGLNAGVENKLGPFQTQLNYAKQRTFGFTPFQFDFSTPGEYVDGTLSFQPSDKLRFNLSGGRDIQNSFSRDLIARVQVSPSPNLYTSLGTSYSPETHDFGDVYGNFRVVRPGNALAGSLALGLRYSGESGLTRANASADLKLDPKTRFQVYAGYDGFSKHFDFTQFRVTRDLHCFNFYTTFDGQRKELRFDLAVKAFPFADSRFGRNQFSETFDPFIGDVR